MSTVLITGASSGIGEALMHEFARHGHDVIAVAKNKEKLEAAVDKHRAMHSVQITPVAKDLTRDGAVQELYEEIQSRGHRVDILVNDAGVGYRSVLWEAPVGKLHEIMRLNIEALTHLTRLYLADMVARNEGKVLNLGSIAGYQPGPLMATYNASKAYVISLSEALSEELKDTNVTVTCLCPGAVDTEFFAYAQMEDARSHDERLMMKPEEVAKDAYRALMDGERVIIPGMLNKAMTFSRRVMPRSVQAKLQKGFYESKEE